MPLQADRKYTGEIIDASLYRSNNKGTLGLELRIQCEEGNIDHTLWLSDKARPNSEKKLKELGITEQEMKSGVFWNAVGTFLMGKRVRIETEQEIYNEKPRVRVKWLNADNGSLEEGDMATAAARLFGGGGAPAPAPQPKPAENWNPEIPPPGDEDMPF